MTGNTRCGQKKNNSGGGSAGFAVVLLFAGLGLLEASRDLILSPTHGGGS